MMPVALSGQAAMIAELQAKLAGALKAQLSLTINPPSIGASIQVAVKALLALQLSLTGPSIVLNFSAVAALMAQVGAALSALLEIQALFGGGAGFALVEFEGSVDGFGADLSALIASGAVPGLRGAQGAGVAILCGADPVTISILKTVFGL